MLASCETIEVVATDDTPPSLDVSVFDARTLNARYDTPPEAMGRVVDTNRPFRVTVSNDRQLVQLLFLARDRQSSIATGQASLQIRFTCIIQFAGHAESPREVNLVRNFGSPGGPGARRPADYLIGVAFTLEDLWQQTCRVFGQLADVRRGRIGGITVRYNARARHNGVRPEVPIGGTFTVDGDGRVDLD